MIIPALAAACFAFYMTSVVRWQRFWKIAYQIICLAFLNQWKEPKRVKPFDCTVCLSAWSGLIFALLDGYGWHSLYIMFIAGVMGLILENGSNRYL